MTKQDDTQRSGLFLGSEPLGGVRHRNAMKSDDTDAGKDKMGDDDGMDSDKSDSDSTDKKADGSDDRRDADGRD